MDSIWTKTCSPPSFPALEGEHHTDVLIIGGGITGLLCAYYFQKQGIDYMVVEASRILSGTTRGTTGKITAFHGLIYHKLKKAIGLEKAGLYLQANLSALKTYQELCRNIDCDWEEQNHYIYSLEDENMLEEELRTLEQLHVPASWVSALPLPLPVKGAVCFPSQAQFHPLKFLSALSSHLNIYEQTRVLKLNGRTAVTKKARIHADQIIIATHFPFVNKYGLYFMKLYQHRSYVLALQKAAIYPGIYNSDQEKGLSFRNHKNTLLLGGGAHRTGKSGGNWKELRDFAAFHYPDSKEICFWAAQDCMPLDSRPYIGPYSSLAPGIYVASGFQKWGMTSSLLAAGILTDHILGKKNPYSTLFSPSRSMLKPQLFLNGLESAKNLLAPSSPRCPHLGCALTWNKAEHSYDCPCHGSRFAKDGALLNNPANKDLFRAAKKEQKHK